jgi:hypothetical protein
MSRATPSKVRELQIKLYRKAKNEPVTLCRSFEPADLALSCACRTSCKHSRPIKRNRIPPKHWVSLLISLRGLKP